MWSLREGEKELKPKVFSNGKSQEDVVNEVVSEIKNGRKVIFIHGVCGSGKSAIALNIAKELGRASIVVPIKNLQRQYKEDYMSKKYLLKANGEKLKIAMITGRRNHECTYLKENKNPNLEKQEKNTNLFDIFEKKQQEEISFDESCENTSIPCRIAIRQKNSRLLKKYYKENPEHGNRNIDLKFMKRLSIAPACKYWSPVYPERLKINLNAKKLHYDSISGKHSIYFREEGCPYYTQFKNYKDADVIIFNSEIYMLETAIGRKPATDVEIIDECDEFLDSFALEGSINLNRLKNELILTSVENSGDRKILKALFEVIAESIYEAEQNLGEEIIIPLRDSSIAELIKGLANNPIEDIINDEESYIESCLETAEKFVEVIEDSYINFYKDKAKGDLYAKIVTINLEKMLHGLIEKNKAFVFMSGTLHSERVLKEIFGIKDFKIINAETFNLGTITKLPTGMEKDFRFENFLLGKVTREDYLKALDKCIAIAKKPIVIQVSAFQNLPSKQEIETLKLNNLISSRELMEQQNQDKEGKLVRDFKEGKIAKLFTTRCSRGIDFPFETCNSMVITKFPYPNTQSLFWRILQKQKPEMFWEFYKDKAHRELLQRVYRSVRAANDHVYLLSPDIRVLESNLFS